MYVGRTAAVAIDIYMMDAITKYQNQLSLRAQGIPVYEEFINY